MRLLIGHQRLDRPHGYPRHDAHRTTRRGKLGIVDLADPARDRPPFLAIGDLTTCARDGRT